MWWSWGEERFWYKEAVVEQSGQTSNYRENSFDSLLLPVTNISLNYLKISLVCKVRKIEKIIQRVKHDWVAETIPCRESTNPS